MKHIPKVSHRVDYVSTKNGFSSNERFEMVIGGGHPDERSNSEWIKLMKEKGYKRIDQQKTGR